MQSPISPGNQSSDPITGTWIISGGTWHFTKDGNDYSLTELSALGQTGQGRATLDGQTLRIEFTSTILGRMSLTFKLNGNFLQGTMPMPFLGTPIPVVLQRA